MKKLESVERSLLLEPERIDVHVVDKPAQIFEVVKVLFCCDLTEVDHGKCPY